MTKQGRTLGFALIVGGVALLGYALMVIGQFVAATVSRAPQVDFDGGGWIAFPIAVIWLILGGAILFGGAGAAEQDHPRRRLISQLLKGSVALLALAAIMPLATYWGAGAYLEKRGYEPCDNEQLGLRSFSRSWQRIDGIAGTEDSMPPSCRA
ncbi:MAG: hypothetical protein AAFQ27_02895 [Pseudomonadota bacterium]